MCKFFELIKTIKEPYYLHNLHENIGAVLTDVKMFVDCSNFLHEAQANIKVTLKQSKINKGSK
jgi:hypothetical protein